MRSVGVDIATAGYAGLALAVDGEPRKAVARKPPDPKDSEIVKLSNFYNWVVFILGQWKPDVVAVEQIAGYPNRHVIQTMSRFEGVALLAAKRSGAIVINPTISQSRGAALPKNNSKEKAWKAIRAKYPTFKFSAANSGGTDEADAMTHALAAPIILERK